MTWRKAGGLVVAVGMGLGLSLSAARGQELRGLPGSPIVYTGYFHNSSTDQNMAARFFLQKSLRVGSATPYLSAIVMLYLGGLDSAEAVDFYYDTVSFNANTRALFLQPTDDMLARRVPVIKLQADVEGRMLSGQLISNTKGDVGTFQLQNGYDLPPPPPGELLTPLSGVYDASCNAQDSSAMNVDSAELLGTRIANEHQGTEGALNVLNYLGNGICHYDGPVSCVSFSAGTYDYFSKKVVLYQGGWVWQCDRLTNDQLRCSSQRYPRCVLDRRTTPVTHIPVQQPAFGYATVLESVETPSGQVATTCAQRQGEFNGLLTHAFSGRRQAVKLVVSTFVQDDGTGTPQCLASGSAQIYFANDGGEPDHLTYLLPQIRIASDAAAQTYYSLYNTGVVLQILQDADGAINGYWYSKLHGLVGTFVATKGEPLPVVTGPTAVYGIGGHYRDLDTLHEELQMTTVESGMDHFSHDPFAGMDVVGDFSRSILYDGRMIQTHDGVQALSYDYFTNLLVLRTGSAVYHGWVDQAGLNLSLEARTYMAKVAEFGYSNIYRRSP